MPRCSAAWLQALPKMAPDIRCLNYAALQPVYGTRAANPAFASR